MKVSSIMTSDLEVVSPQETVEIAARKCFEADIRHLPVVDDGQLVGIISDRDLKGFVWSFQNTFTQADEDRWPSTKIFEIMHTDPVSVDPDSEVKDVLDIMVDNKIGAVLVVHGDDSQKLLGIVSYIDVLRYARSLYEMDVT